MFLWISLAEEYVKIIAFEIVEATLLNWHKMITQDNKIKIVSHSQQPITEQNLTALKKSIQ